MTIPIPIATTVPESRQAIVARLVIGNLRRHPWLDPIREVGYPIAVSCHTRAIWADTIRDRGGKYAIEARIETEEWWKRPLIGQDEGSRRLARALAKEVLRRWRELEGEPKMGRRKLNQRQAL